MALPQSPTNSLQTLLLEAITGGAGVAPQLVLRGGQLMELRYTRRQENCADETAIATMLEMGLDPASLASAFEALEDHVMSAREEGRGEGGSDSTRPQSDVPAWLASHPNIDARIAQAWAAARPSTAIALSAEDWSAR